jgi:glycosyltransferase involved in cell wall biosynthesis
MTRVLYIVAQPVRWIAFEWIARDLDRREFELTFVLMNDGPPPLGPPLAALGIRYHHLQIRGRHELGRAILSIKALCQDHRIDIVHAHFTTACLAGLPGALLAGVKWRIQTRHHAGPFPRSHRPWWGALYDRAANRLSTRIVAPSREVERALIERERVPASKVLRIEHGFDLAAFAEVPAAQVAAMRTKYGVAGPGPIVGVVARYEWIKGVQLVVRAFRALLRNYPGARLVLANARGKATEGIRRELKSLPPASYVEIAFEPEMAALYQLFDIFVHVPLAAEYEAFGQVYVEAWAAGVPSVITPAGIAAETARNREEACVVDFGSSEQILAAMKLLLSTPGLREALQKNALRLVRERFGLAPMIRRLEELYRGHARATLPSL